MLFRQLFSSCNGLNKICLARDANLVIQAARELEAFLTGEFDHLKNKGISIMFLYFILIHCKNSSTDTFIQIEMSAAETLKLHLMSKYLSPLVAFELKIYLRKEKKCSVSISIHAYLSVGILLMHLKSNTFCFEILIFQIVRSAEVI